MSLRMQLNPISGEQVNDSAGAWYFESGQVFEVQKYVANYISVYRIIDADDIMNQYAWTFTTTFFFFNGNGPGENFTAQGGYDLSTQSDIGSVSSASPALSKYIGKKYKMLFETYAAKVG